MSDNVNIVVEVQDQIYGSMAYTISVKLINGSNNDLESIAVEPILIPGRLVNFSEKATEEIEVDELESQKRRLIDELETQIDRAYMKYRLSDMTFAQKFDFAMSELVNGYVSLFTPGKQPKSYPVWAKEALKIHEWADVERLERDVMSFEKEGSFLQKAFLINKDKLSRILDKIAEKGVAQHSFITGPSLQPGGSIAFPFTIKAPHLFRAKKGDFQFKVSYKNSVNDKITTQSVGCKATLSASPFAVPTGGMLGAICGYLVRFTIAIPSPETLNISWIGLGGSLLLGLVTSIILSRKPEVNKAITVEDFVGGFVIGALAGLFSEQIIQKLGLLVK